MQFKPTKAAIQLTTHRKALNLAAGAYSSLASNPHGSTTLRNFRKHIRTTLQIPAGVTLFEPCKD
jgi:hypothetical protein